MPRDVVSRCIYETARKELAGDRVAFGSYEDGGRFDVTYDREGRYES